MKKAAAAYESGRVRSADAYRQLDRLTIHYLGLSAIALVVGIIAVAVMADKGVDSLSTLAAGALGYLGGRFNNRRTEPPPPGTITATPPVRVSSGRLETPPPAAAPPPAARPSSSKGRAVE